MTTTTALSCDHCELPAVATKEGYNYAELLCNEHLDAAKNITPNV